MRFHVPGFDHLVTAFPKSDIASITYIRMLIHGPFRAFSDLITLKRASGEDYYLRVSHLERWPANVLFNFCIASRVPIEFPHLFDHWGELIGAGYPEVFAFLLSYTTDGSAFKSKRKFPNNNHFWFDPAADWLRILEGTPDMSAAPFKSVPLAILPTNTIWGRAETCRKLESMSDEDAAEYFGVTIRRPAPVKKAKPSTFLKNNFFEPPPPGFQGIDIGNDPAPAAMAAHFAQIIQAQQNQAAAQGVPVFNQIQLQQPPQPPNWEIDLDDDNDDNYPEIDDDFEEFEDDPDL